MQMNINFIINLTIKIIILQNELKIINGKN